MEELEYLEIWCNTMNDLLMKSMESRFMSKKRKQMIKGQIIGIDKVLEKIKQIKRDGIKKN